MKNKIALKFACCVFASAAAEAGAAGTGARAQYQQPSKRANSKLVRYCRFERMIVELNLCRLFCIQQKHVKIIPLKCNVMRNKVNEVLMYVSANATNMGTGGRRGRHTMPLKNQSN